MESIIKLNTYIFLSSFWLNYWLIGLGTHLNSQTETKTKSKSNKTITQSHQIHNSYWLILSHEENHKLNHLWLYNILCLCAMTMSYDTSPWSMTRVRTDNITVIKLLISLFLLRRVIFLTCWCGEKSLPYATDAKEDHSDAADRPNRSISLSHVYLSVHLSIYPCVMSFSSHHNQCHITDH